MSTTLPSKSKIVFNSQRFGVTVEDNAIGNQTNDLLASVIEKLTAAVVALQATVSALDNNQASFDQLISLQSESNVKLGDIKAKLDLEISTLSGVNFSLQVLHTDNLAAQAKLDEIEQELDDANTNLGVLHSDNLVVEDKIDAVAISVENFNADFDSVKQTTNAQEVLRVQLSDTEVLGRILDVLQNIQTQLSFVTEETLEEV